jgi:Xanthine and CO dehydrogenases maturation factor, XdhC/CoxF family
MIRIFERASEYVKRGEPCALVTVVRTSGSVPRHAGAKMLVDTLGTLLEGTIGGGEMESRACSSPGRPSPMDNRAQQRITWPTSSAAIPASVAARSRSSSNRCCRPPPCSSSAQDTSGARWCTWPSGAAFAWR